MIAGRCFRSAFVVFALICAVSVAGADVRLHRLFSDNMILQRDAVVPVWGWAAPGEAVTVQFRGINLATKAGKDGKWIVKLPEMEANVNPRDMTIQGKNLITLKNILIGDVWLCSGQSNMQFNLGGCNAPADIASADLPLVRFIQLPMITAERPREDVETREPWFHWYPCTTQTAGGLSAVAYYFARKVTKETGVPIGLLVSSVGGTNIEKWMPNSAFYDNPALSDVAKSMDAAIEEYRKDVAASLPKLDAWSLAAKKALKLGLPLPEMPEVPRHPFMPGSKAGGNWVHLYNGMIHPLAKFPIHGALWYQGENNGNELDSYVAKMTALIGSWRKLWGADFPFYYVQLANWLKPGDDPSGGSDGWQRCRMAQFKCLSIPKTGMAVTIDIGETEDIHPKDKLDVGERLALWALAKDYGKTGLVYSGPLYSGMKIEDGQIRLAFENVGDGLMVGKKDGRNPTQEVLNGTLQRFAIAGADRQWHWANAAIDGLTVIVRSPEVAHPVAVRYAYAMNPEGCNLYNRQGLPASPFRTDNW